MAQHRFTPEVVYDYVEELDANLICAICQSALVDPVTTTSCKHTFCRDCIERAISVNPQCPIDRSALTTHSLRETEQLVRLMLDELKVRCAADGCGAVMQRGLLLAHLRTCPMAVTMCEDGDCGLKMSKQRVSEHRAYECFQRKMECDKCGVLLSFKDQTPRHLKSCNPGSSQNAELDTCDLCEEKSIITRSSLATHLKACPFEAMSAFFVANDARFKAMGDRQEQLSREVATLRADLQAERALAGVTGWRVGEHSHAAGPSDSAPLPGQPGSPHTTTAELHHPAPTLPSPQSPEFLPPNPSRRHPSGGPPPGITPRAAADFAAPRSLFSPSFGSRQSYADWAFHHLADPSSTSLAALEAAVGRLRRVVLQLAAGLDTMERRNEVRTMTESLRILEEVGALRAIVNSIRLRELRASHVILYGTADEQEVMIDRPGTPSLRRSFGTIPTPSTNDLPSTLPNTGTAASEPLPRSSPDGEEGESSSMHESISFSGQGYDPPGANSRSHIWALQDMSRRRAVRDATAGGITGEPMRIPPTPPERNDPMEDPAGPRSSSRLGRAMSNGLLSMRAGRRNTGTGPRL